jgi:hypothetical protein
MRPVEYRVANEKDDFPHATRFLIVGVAGQGGRNSSPTQLVRGGECWRLVVSNGGWARFGHGRALLSSIVVVRGALFSCAVVVARHGPHHTRALADWLAVKPVVIDTYFLCW